MKRWKRAEFNTAEDSSGRRVAYSGAGLEDGDVRTPGFLIDVKTALSASPRQYSLHVNEWEKILHESKLEGLLPAMDIYLQSIKLFIMRRCDFKALRPQVSQQFSGIALSRARTRGWTETSKIITENAWLMLRSTLVAELAPAALICLGPMDKHKLVIIDDIHAHHFTEIAA